MSFLFAQPEMLGAAATDLASIGSAISTANAAAAAATTRVLAAGADEVSAAVAALFSGHAQTYQALSTQAAAFHQQIVQTLTSTAGAYASAEAANVEQQLLGAINAPTMALLGRPLIGHGADGAPGTGQAGGPAGSVRQRRQRRVADVLAQVVDAEVAARIPQRGNDIHHVSSVSPGTNRRTTPRVSGERSTMRPSRSERPAASIAGRSVCANQPAISRPPCAGRCGRWPRRTSP